MFGTILLFWTQACGVAPAMPTVPTSHSSAVQAFTAWLEAHPDPDSLNAQELGSAQQLLRARVGELQELMRHDPAGFERAALPESVRDRLPESLKNLLEEHVSGTGFIGVYCDLPRADGAAGTPAAGGSGIRREVIVNGKTYEARVHGAWREQTTAGHVLIQGVALGDTIVLGESPAPAATDPITATAPSLNTANTVLYMIARFSDQAVDPIDNATALKQMGVVSTFWSNNSGGRVGLCGLRNPAQPVDIVHIVLPRPSSYGATYNGAFATLLNDARTAAAALGYDYTSYNLDVVVTSSDGFTYAGRSYIAGQGSHLVAGYTSLRTAGHELGHNLGLQHANYWRTDSCAPLGKDSTPGGYDADINNGEWVEYGHFYSVMSAQFGSEMEDPALPHYAPVEKVRLGWLTGSQVQYASSSGLVRLFRHDHPATTGVPRAVRVEPAATDYTGSGRRYWLGYRCGAWNTAQTWLRNGVQVDAAQVSYGTDGAVLLDMTPYSRDDAAPFFDPNNKPGSWWTIDNGDKLDAALVVGHTFSDLTAGIHITPIATGNNGPNEDYIDLMIQLGKFPTNRPPDISGLCASAISAGINQPITFSVAAADPDGDALAYSWDFEEPQVFTSSGLNAPTATRAWTTPGQYRVKVTVSDMKGGLGTASLVVTIGVPANTNQIWGRVLWGGKPVSGARIATSAAGASRQAWTGSDGAYVLTSLPGNSTYTLTASSPGLTLLPQAANPVVIGTANAYGIDFYAAETAASPAGAGSTISGTVYDPIFPAAGIEVRAGGLATTTDSSGNYQFTNFPSATYTVTAWAPGWTFSPASRTVVLNGANAPGNNFGRVATNTISGALYGIPSTQTPAPVVCLSNGRSANATKAGTSSNRYWAYSFANVPNGQYSLSADVAGFRIVPSGFTNPVTLGTGVTNFNFNATAAASVAGSVSGRILLANVPLKGATVNALVGTLIQGTAVTDADGYFRVANLANVACSIVPVLAGHAFSPASLNLSAVPASGLVFNALGGPTQPSVTGITASPATVAVPGNTSLSASAAGTAPFVWHWDVGASAPGPVTFSVNDSSLAASTVANFSVAGTYTFRVRVTDANGLTASRNLSVQVLGGGSGALAVTPFEFQLAPGNSISFQAAAWNSAGTSVPINPTWSVSGGGSISQAGVFTATQSGGPYIVTAAGEGITATASVWVGVTPGLNDTVPRIQSLATANGAATLRWNALSGFTYRVEVATDPKGSWTAIVPTITAAGPTISWSETLSGPRRFYRIVRLP